MNVTKVDTLRVPGASLYYEVRGSGPVLLMIGAGAADAASFNGIATHLAEQYTVVSYDRRSYSRSPDVSALHARYRRALCRTDSDRDRRWTCFTRILPSPDRHPPGRAHRNSRRGVSQPSCWLCESPESIRRAVARRSDRNMNISA